MKLKFNKFFFLYLFFSVILIFKIIFFEKGLPLKYDWSWPLFISDYGRDLFKTDATGLVSLTTKNAELLLSVIGLSRISPELFFKLFILFVHTIAGYTFFLLVQRYIKNKTICFIAGLAYAFTPYLFIRTIVGFKWSLLAYAVLPLFIKFYFEERKKVIHYIFLGILFSLIAAQNQAGLLIGLVLLVNIILQVFYHNFKMRFKSLVWTVLLFVFFNAYWIIFAYSPSKKIDVISGSSTTTLNYIANLPHSLRNIFMLSDHLVTKEFFYALSHNRIFLIGWLIVWLVALCAIFNKKNRELILTFIISSIIVLPFVKGPTGIFGNFYVWFYNHVPQIAVFRETYHFEFLYAIALCILFAFGLDWLWTRIDSYKSAVGSRQSADNNSSKSANRKLQTANLLRTGLKTLFASSAIFIIAPYLTFDYAGYLRLQKIPQEYNQLYNFLQTNKDYCKKIYYPPGLGFLYFKGDKTPDAVNSDVLGKSLGVNYLDSGFSVLNLPDSQSYYQTELVSQFYEKQDRGEFVMLMNEVEVDCIVLRLDTESKYYQASNLWRESDPAIVKKWNQTDLKALTESKKGLKLEKQFGENIYIYKPVGSRQSAVGSNLSISENKPPSADGKLLTYLPLADWANDYAYYKDGWSRGRYDFWRKHLFTQLRQDFIYTDKQGAILSGKIEQEGDYELWVRYLTGGNSGKFSINLQLTTYNLQHESGDEKFIWKKIGDIKLDGQTTVEVKNIIGENAIADLVLVKQ